MTRLATIANNNRALACALCGHTALLPVTAAIEMFGQSETVHHVTKRVRYSRCKVNRQNTFQIVYIGEG